MQFHKVRFDRKYNIVKEIKLSGGVHLEEERPLPDEKASSNECTPEPWKSALFSLIFPGLGQLNNGETGKGTYYFAIAFILIIASYLIIPIFIYIIFWLYNIYDAYKVAREKQLDQGL